MTLHNQNGVPLRRLWIAILVLSMCTGAIALTLQKKEVKREASSTSSSCYSADIKVEYIDGTPVFTTVTHEPDSPLCVN